MTFYARAGLDEFLLQAFFRAKRGGTFVDVGAGDGQTANSTAFFERTMGWRGLCIEPSKDAFAKLKTNRKVACERAAWTELPALLEKHNLHEIDYCAFDARAAGTDVLSRLDFQKFRIAVLSVESVSGRIAEFLDKNGYNPVTRLAGSVIFHRRDVVRLPRSSVICAVWHGDPNRHELLRSHAANLAAQSVPVEPIYVFDGGDQSPAWLKGRTVSVRENLSIYQAWNVALSLVATPHVMNLNLDDRLAPDGVATLEDALLREGAAIASGDWKVCYSQKETDEVQPCYPSSRVPFLPAWPPVPGSLTRLGSSNEKETLGPASMWCMDAHLHAPRYPWRLPDGTLISNAGDAAWWVVLQQHARAKFARLKLIIGNYHSHPQSQAEFRALPHDELQLVSALGISLL